MSHPNWLPPWKARIQQQAEAERVKREGERDNAILAAINSLVNELRSEHQRQAAQDTKKSSREKWTIRGLFLTASVALAALAVSLWQVNLTQRSIHDSEQASSAQAKETQSSLRIAQRGADAASRQATLAKETLVTGSRAWIGVEHTASPNPVANKALQVTVQYLNTGRQPATGVQVASRSFSFPITEQKKAGAALQKFDNQCTSLPQANVGVVYPTTGFSRYTYMRTISPKKIDSGVVGGTKLLAIAGCFTYETFQAVHYSYFCMYYKAGTIEKCVSE